MTPVNKVHLNMPIPGLAGLSFPPLELGAAGPLCFVFSVVLQRRMWDVSSRWTWNVNIMKIRFFLASPYKVDVSFDTDPFPVAYLPSIALPPLHR